MNVYWVEDNTKFNERELISDLYALNDSRCEYTITIRSKSYLFYEKYICYTISASYDIFEKYDRSINVSPYLRVRCKFSSQHPASDLEDTPTRTLEYKISIDRLLNTSIFQHRSFEIWNGKVIVDGVKIKLIP